MRKADSNRGFTLVEIMFVVFLLSMLLAGVMSFFVQSVKSMYASEQRLKLAGQIKKFSTELVVQASRSNQFILYKSASPADFDGTNPTFLDVNGDIVSNPDRQRIDATDPLNLLHPAGDFAVFVYYEIPKPVAQPFSRITKLEGYFLTTATAGGIGAVTKVVIDLSATPSTSSVEAILTAKWNSTARFTTYFPQARGLATPQIIDGTAVTGTGTPTPRLFYMSDARNVLISGQIYSSTKDIATSDWKTLTDSFFFTITPRT